MDNLILKLKFNLWAFLPAFVSQHLLEFHHIPALARSRNVQTCWCMPIVALTFLQALLVFETNHWPAFSQHYYRLFLKCRYRTFVFCFLWVFSIFLGKTFFAHLKFEIWIKFLNKIWNYYRAHLILQVFWKYWRDYYWELTKFCYLSPYFINL